MLSFGVKYALWQRKAMWKRKRIDKKGIQHVTRVDREEEVEIKRDLTKK
jgi:hypothetical protein